MSNESHWSPGHGVSCGQDRDVVDNIRRQQYINKAGRYRTHAEHDVFHSSVGDVRAAPTRIVDIDGEQLQSFRRTENPRYDNERKFISEKAMKSIVPEKDRDLVNAIRKCAHKLLQKHSKPHDVFANYDGSKTRHVDFNGFRQALRYVGCELDLQGSRLLFDHYGERNEDSTVVSRLNYDYFIAAMLDHGNDDRGTTLLLPEHAKRVHKLRTGYNDDQHHDHFDVLQAVQRIKSQRGQATSPTAKRNETLNAMTGQYEKGLARTLSPLAKSDYVDRRHFSKEDQRYFMLKSKVINMIRRADYGKMIHHFTRFDRSMEGTVDLDNFLQVLQQVGIRMSRDDGKRIFNDFKVEQEKAYLVKGQKNLLDYHAFVDAVIPGHTSLRNGSGAPASAEKRREITEGQARRCIIQQRVFDILKDRKEQLSTSLQQIDVNATGQLDFKSFWKATKMAGVILSDADTRRIFDRFDVVSSGFVRYDDIIQMLGCKNVKKDGVYSVDNRRDATVSSNGNRRASYIPDPSKPTAFEMDRKVRVVNQRVIDQVAQAAPRLYEIFKLVPQKDYRSTFIDLVSFSTSIRNAGIILSENDSISLYRSIEASGPAGEINYMQFLDMLNKESSLRRRATEPPVYIQEGSAQYDNILSSAGSMLGREPRYNDKTFGVGLVPVETDNVSRTGNLMVEKVLLRIVNQCDMTSNLLERAFIGLTGAFGEISRQDFLMAMKRIGVKLNQQETNAIFKKLNPKNPKILDLNDFLLFIRTEYGKWRR